MSRRRLCDLPGWEAAAKAAAIKTRSDGSTYSASIGNALRVVGAFIPPPSIDEVTPSLVRAMLVGVFRHSQIKADVEKRAKRETERVVRIEDARLRLQFRAIEARRERDDWTQHWTADDLAEPGASASPARHPPLLTGLNGGAS